MRLIRKILLAYKKKPLRILLCVFMEVPPETLKQPTPKWGLIVSTPKGNRTPVLALRGLCHGPLDDGGVYLQRLILTYEFLSVNQEPLLPRTTTRTPFSIGLSDARIKYPPPPAPLNFQPNA